MSNLSEYEIICDFCGKKRKFENCNQVILKIEKTNNHQNLFGMRCEICDESNIKKTLSGQSLKIITSRNSLTEEVSILTSKDEGDI